MNKVKAYLPHFLSVLVIIILNVILFLPQFEGKVIRQGDVQQAGNMVSEIQKYSSMSDEPVLWTNSMFGGMPTYQVYVPHNGNKIHLAKGYLHLFFNAPVGLFVSGMLCLYLAMLFLGVSPMVALLSSIFFGLTTSNFILYEAGHITKVDTVFMSPFIIAGLILGFKRKYIFGSILFALGMALNVSSGHPQMTFYLGLTLAVFVFVHIVKSILEKEFLHLLKLGAYYITALVIGVGVMTSSYWVTYEYGKDTMRGGNILNNQVKSGEIQNQVKSGGLDWDYSMAWSNGFSDVVASFIPKAVGGGSGEWVDRGSELAKAVGRNQAFQAPTYWGELPFTSGPFYFGAVALFVFCLGFIIIKDSIKYLLGVAVLFTLLLSMGKNFSLLNRFLFDYLPMFNKFRAPNSVTSISIIFIAIQAGLTMHYLINAKDKKTLLKPLLYSISIMGGIAAFFFIMGGVLFNFQGQDDGNYAQIIDALTAQRRSMLTSSALRSLMFVLISGGIIWLYLKEKFSSNIMIASVGILSLVDSIGVNNDYLGKRNWVKAKTIIEEKAPRPVDQQILEDKDINYRVLDVTINTFNDAKASAYHKTIGGYHAAKLRRYQDIIEKHISQNNMNVLNMLNTKYFIVKGNDGQPAVQLNPGALGSAWLVDSIKLVNTPDEEIDALTSFNPANLAIVHSEFKNYLGNLDPPKGGQIKNTIYSPNRLEYDYNSTSEQLAIFSEIWYGPDKGWIAYIDGKEVDHVRANYILRAMKLPAGSHKITFRFQPKSYFLGQTFNLICSLLIFAGIALLLFLAYRRSSLVKIEEEFAAN